jgi:hypothetical protein
MMEYMMITPRKKNLKSGNNPLGIFSLGCKILF